jgi:sensor domain CHASE-containing protein
MEVGLFPPRKAAFEQARDEHRLIATAPVRLLQPFNTTGYILYSPVFNERGFVGCVVFAFRVDQLLNGFAHGRRIPMNFRVYDATDPGQMIVGGYAARRNRNRQFVCPFRRRGNDSADLGFCRTKDVGAV